MDLGSFADEVLDAVAGICGDAIVEDFEKACDVLDALARKPGRDRRELAAAFGLTLQQFENCRQRGVQEKTKNAVYDDLCRSDAVYAGNVLVQRINEAAHWREEFRDMQNAVDQGEEDECSEAGTVPEEDGDAASVRDVEVRGEASQVITADVRNRASAVLAKHLDASDALKRSLVRRLDEEIHERCPLGKDYRHCVRGIAASLRRNTMLAAAYTSGRVPPQWVVNASGDALAPRMAKMGVRVLQKEILKDAKMDDETAEQRRKSQVAGRGTTLAPPPINELGGDHENIFN